VPDPAPSPLSIGTQLPLLLLAGYRSLADAGLVGLAARGHEDARPVHGLALRVIASGADTGSEVASRLGVSKQAAAKTIAVLQTRGYVAREPDPGDRRRKHLRVTDHGLDLLREVDATFEQVRETWGQVIGVTELDELQAHLVRLVGADLPSFDTPAWIARDLNQPE
jgi:DNA-binding MarR family transcriptional regulator